MLGSSAVTAPGYAALQGVDAQGCRLDAQGRRLDAKGCRRGLGSSAVTRTYPMEHGSVHPPDDPGVVGRARHRERLARAGLTVREDGACVVSRSR